MNPKIWLFYYALEQSPPGLPINRIVVRLENGLNCLSLVYPEGTGNPIQTTLKAEEFCGLASIYLGIPFLIGTERTAVYNGETHQKVIAMSLSLPDCLATIDYEDYPVRLNFSDSLENFLRDKCLEVTFGKGKD